MRRTILAIVACGAGALAGCGSQPQWVPQEGRQELFEPAGMRIHPVFTEVKDWSGDAKVDGIDALIEFQDQFGDPAKASGSVLFEVFEYRPYAPDRRGRRVVAPFVTTIDNVAAQRDHWNRTSRCYNFQLALPTINPRQTYVVTATFEKVGGGRFTDQLLLQPRERAQGQPAATKPAK